VQAEQTHGLRIVVTDIDRQFLKIQVIDIAVAPVFTGFERFNDRMTGGMRVPAGMLVFRVVAAADMPTGLAQAQMDPGISHRKAFFTAIAARRHRLDLFQMQAGVFHHLPSDFIAGCQRQPTSELQVGVDIAAKRVTWINACLFIRDR
jgi:hypothetical protein